ncbi:MAG: iron ABC transporter permease [Rubrobacter sp.]|nr:iron ABC transporter permease [Rubrobacter sp.]
MKASRWRGKKTVRGGKFPFSFKIDMRSVFVFIVLGAIAIAGIVINVGVGEYPISPPDVVRTIFGIELADGNYDFIVNTLRLPRALVAFLVGLALALSGAILQGLTRNPLAAPDIIGINAGAGLAAVSLIVVFPSVSAAFVPPAAFVGACVVAALLYVIAWRGNSSPIRLILIGIGLGAIAGAMTTFMITFGDIYEVSQALVWLTGSVYGRSWDEVASFLPWLIVFVPIVILCSRHLNTLGLGDEVAVGLGSRVERQRGLLIFCSVALAASAVATAGTVGFVAFIAPHIARQLVGPNHGGLLPVSAVVGGVIVVLADLVGRTIVAPIEIPCGIVTSIIGAPYFLYLLYRSSQVK